MGLSIYFSKVNKRDYSLNQKTAINDEIEICYFRDVYCLLTFFDYAYIVHNGFGCVDSCESEIYSGVIFPTGFAVKDCAIHVINSQFRI